MGRADGRRQRHHGRLRELQGRREQAERHADRIFELSQDLLCIAGFDGYFKRVNPAFARLLGYSTETMLSRPTREFVHPDDRAARDARHAQRAAGGHVRYEQRQLCSDGSVRRVEWSARFVPEEQLVYGVGRDVTETRRAAEEQAALRSVATLVAKGAPPAEIFAAVAREVRALFGAASAGVVRLEPDGSFAVLGSGPGRIRRAARERRRRGRRRRTRDPYRRCGRRPDRRRGPPVGRRRRRRAPSRCRPAPRSGSPASPTSSPRRSRTPRAARRSPRPARASWRPATRSAGGVVRDLHDGARRARAHDHHARARVRGARAG
jgi:PAS domain S-box-containing protein